MSSHYPMEDSKHSYRRKHSHSQRQSTRKAAFAVTTDNMLAGSEQPPVLDKLIERDSRDSALRKYAQHVLGPYVQYQSAIKEMDTSEQMYGIAEPLATTLQSRDASKVSQPAPLPADQKRGKIKKNKRTTKLEVGGDKTSSAQSTSAQEYPDAVTVRKKASVQPYNKVSQQSGAFDRVPHSETDTKGRVTCGLSASSGSPPQQTPPDGAKYMKKVKKSRKRTNSLIEEASSGSVAAKPRPEALNILVSESGSTPGQSDGPDTGDVRHMLQELLHPPPVSLVTPILTPNKLQPFTFPTSVPHSSHHVFKTPNSSDNSHFGLPPHITSSSAVQQHPSTQNYKSEVQRKNPLTSVSGQFEAMSRSSQSWVHGSGSSSSSSSSSGSSTDSEGGSSSDASSCSSREQSPFRQSSEDEVVIEKEVYIPQPFEDKDEGTRITLEKLKQQVTPSNMATITPLKKTPPHFISVAEELANFSPPKASKATLVQRDLAANLTSQSSLGFHFTGGGNTENGGTGQSSGSTSSEESEDENQVNVQQLERKDVSSVGQPSSNPALGTVHREHLPALLQQPVLSPPPKKRRKKKGQDLMMTSKKHKTSDHLVSNKLPSTKTKDTSLVSFTASRVSEEAVLDESSLLVSIPLTDVKIGKPKATVEPYNVRSTTSNRRNTLESMAEAEEAQNRDRFSRFQGEDYGAGLLPLHDYHTGPGVGPTGRGERPRAHGHSAGRWERDTVSRDHRSYGIPPRSSGRGPTGDYAGRSHSSHNWDRESHYRASNVPSEEYWSESGHFEGARIESQRAVGRTYPRKMDPEYFMLEAKRRKKEADKIMVPGLEKARLYMESVTYFMRHGGAIEHEQLQAAAGHNQPVKRNPYKMYSDTVNMIKYCQHMAGECKPLLVLCLRCQSALYWRMYLIKQPSIAPVQKELQEFFLPSKASQSKSPFPGGLSPLPSPASVGSTASTSSAGTASCSQASGLGDSATVTVPRHIFNKAADQLTVSALINTCLELWRLSDSYMEQCREFFLNADRKANLTVHYYSPVFQVASWVEDILKCF